MVNVRLAEYSNYSIVARYRAFELQFNKRNDSRMNNHMPFASVIWVTNVDFTPIISTDAVYCQNTLQNMNRLQTH